MRYQTLLFDVDDTLLDFQAAEDQALSNLFQAQGLTLTPALKKNYQKLNRSLWEKFEQGLISREEVVDSRFGLFFAEYGQAVDSAKLEQNYRYYLNQGHQLLGNSRQIVADLAQQAELYVVTNGVSATQYQRLTDSKLLPYFKDIFVSEDTGYQKPMKEYFDFVFARIPQFDRQKTVIIGDSLTSDIKGGQTAGIATVWLNPTKKIPLPAIKPTYQIQALEELYPLLAD